MNPAIKQRLLPYVAVLVFILFKIPYLHYAFYWDESWVYAPAVRWMYAHGVTILPGAMPADLSRGHPLLFHGACAAWMHLFGGTNCAMHCFALFVSVLLAVALFECTLRLFGLQVALIGLTLLLFNIEFFVSSSFVLTDVMLALFTLLAIYAYATELYISAAIFLTLLVFTKESGVVACAVIGMYILAGAVSGKISLKMALRRSIIVVVPVVFFLLFFALQKRNNGWYLYPAHISAINLDIENTMFNIHRSLCAIFLGGYAYLYYAPLMVLASWVAIRQRQRKYLLILLCLSLLYPGIAVFSSKDVYWYLLMIFVAVILYLFINAKVHYYSAIQVGFLRISVFFCVAYIYFCSINFFESRYLFPALFLISALLLAVAFGFFLAKVKRSVFAYLLAGIACIGLYGFTHERDAFQPYMRMEVQQQLVDFLEENDFYDRYICCPPYIESVHLSDPSTGFLRSGKAFSHVGNELDSCTQLAIFDNMEPCSSLYSIVSADTDFMLLRHFEKGDAWIEVYARK